MVLLGPPTDSGPPAAAGADEADGFACSADNFEATVN